jgi:hypothetical protein
MTAKPKRLRTSDPDTEKALAYVGTLAQDGFWGAVKIRFEAGRAVHIAQEESLIPSKLMETPLKLHEHSNT